jgi:D-alanyl-D-alanine carboxypeptidase (penicillin-binding protein 5/6)
VDVVDEVPVSRVIGVLRASLLIIALVPVAAGAGEDLRGLTAKAAIVVDHRSGGIIFSRNPELKLPPASTTKILTAHLALWSGKLDQDFRVSGGATRMQPSKIWLGAGWRVNVLDLVYAILLNSANDASVVLAEGLAGSVPQFAAQMTQAARAMGATHSQFVNPSGLPAVGHYSTARDLALIMRTALRYPHFRKILSTKGIVIRPTHGSHRRIRLRSHNRLLTTSGEPRVIGKTGYTKRAKRCFVGAASQGGAEVLVAVLGSRDLWGDVRRLIHYGLERASNGQHQLTENDWEEILPAATSVSSVAEAFEPRKTFHVRLAAFRQRSRADGLQKKVSQQGYDEVVVENLLAGSRPLYRVTVRGFTSRKTAQEAARRLARTYRIEPQVVAIGA